MAGNFIEGDEKARLRRALEGSRRALSPQQIAVLGGEVHQRLAAQAFFQEARVVALYAAQPFEVPTAALFERLRGRGVRCAFPRVVPGQRELQFAEVASPGELVPAGRLGLLEPGPGAPAVPLAAFDLALVPGVGFTAAGHRLGRGGGHYDATLVHMAGALRVGLAFELGLVPSLPAGQHDLTMDVVVTELRLFRCRGEGA